MTFGHLDKIISVSLGDGIHVKGSLGDVLDTVRLVFKEDPELGNLDSLGFDNVQLQRLYSTLIRWRLDMNIPNRLSIQVVCMDILDRALVLFDVLDPLATFVSKFVIEGANKQSLIGGWLSELLGSVMYIYCLACVDESMAMKHVVDIAESETVSLVCDWSKIDESMFFNIFSLLKPKVQKTILLYIYHPFMTREYTEMDLDSTVIEQLREQTSLNDPNFFIALKWLEKYYKKSINLENELDQSSAQICGIEFMNRLDHVVSTSLAPEHENEAAPLYAYKFKVDHRVKKFDESSKRYRTDVGQALAALGVLIQDHCK